jgi:hypothetical protein
VAKLGPRLHNPPALPYSAVSYQVNITELIEPEAVLGSGDSWEIIGLETFIAEPNSLGQPAADPAVHQTLMASRLGEGCISQQAIICGE